MCLLVVWVVKEAKRGKLTAAVNIFLIHTGSRKYARKTISTYVDEIPKIRYSGLNALLISCG
jgi:hypothetical protein